MCGAQVHRLVHPPARVLAQDRRVSRGRSLLHFVPVTRLSLSKTFKFFVLIRSCCSILKICTACREHPKVSGGRQTARKSTERKEKRKEKEMQVCEMERKLFWIITLNGL